MPELALDDVHRHALAGEHDRVCMTCDSDNTNSCYLYQVCYTCRMPHDEEVTFADHVGRFYARRYGCPPMVGRVLGYLLVCDPKEEAYS